jgi:high-affinity iron transporter
MTAAHSALEAGWLLFGQAQLLDLTAVVRPGSVQASLLTGVLGIQPRPVLVEVIGWLAYLIPMSCYLFWPRRRTPAGRAPAATSLPVNA